MVSEPNDACEILPESRMPWMESPRVRNRRGVDLRGREPNGHATHKDEASFIPPAKYPIINQAVLAACDALDGVKDGVLEDPRRCTFVAPRNTINYYEAVRSSLGTIDDSMRLFMVPGMNHCQGGTGTASFDGLAALEAWVERQQVPSRIPTSHVENGVTTRTRPLCSIHRSPSTFGSGSPDAAESFTCKGP